MDFADTLSTCVLIAIMVPILALATLSGIASMVLCAREIWDDISD